MHAGDAAVLAGTLSGTGNGGRQVVLQSNPWPYTQGFLNAGNPQVTNANGQYSFPILETSQNDFIAGMAQAAARWVFGGNWNRLQIFVVST